MFCAQELQKSKQLNGLNEGHFPNNDKIGNMSKPPDIKCYPSCSVQENSNQISFVPYPQKLTFFYQDYFCYTASHILQISCTYSSRRYFIDLKYPQLCTVLEDFANVFGKNSTCSTWPDTYFAQYEEKNETLTDEMFEYARDNLALIHVLIQSPYVAKIRRDEAMTLISYVANTGGLLGLFLGFSFISLIEVLYWCFFCCHSGHKWVDFQNDLACKKY